MATKDKKDLELEEEEVLTPEEKIAEGDELLDAEENDEDGASGEDAALDDTELDPFKDRWEE